MASFVKDSEHAAATTTPAVPASPATKAAEVAPARPQPVALEIPVTVNGARTIEGSDKREPFSEATKTVLVFGRGAVIRLASAVAPGQLVFLTNEKTKKEVVCQVVKSKNYRTVTGYVELEFTEPAVGFWGMRFPSDRIGPASLAPVTPKAPLPAVPESAKPAAPAVPGQQVAPAPSQFKPVAPVLPVAPAVPQLQPVVIAPRTTPAITNPEIAAAAPLAPSAETPKSFVPPQRRETVSPAPAPQQAPKAPPATVSNLPVAPPLVLTKPESLPAPQHVNEPKCKTIVPEPSSQELKLQAAHLQQQLSSLAPLPPAPPQQAPAMPDTATKVLELAQAGLKPQAPVESSSVPPPPKPFSAASEPKPAPPSLAVEEVKIPSWLTGASNTLTPPAVVEKDSVPSWLAPLSHDTLPAVPQTPVIGPPAAVPDPAPIVIQAPEESFAVEVEEPFHRPDAAVFGGQLLGESRSDSSPSKSGSKKGLILAIAATVLLVAGGFWYSRQPGNFISSLLAPKPATTRPVSVPSPLSASAAPRTDAPPAALNPKSSVPAPAEPSPAAGQPVPSASPAPNQPLSASPAPTVKNMSAPIAPERANPPAVEPKKPVLGDVRLAAPQVRRKGQSLAAGEAEPSLDTNPAASSGDVLADLTSSNHAEPLAPLPVGGEVKQALLTKSVPPVYPSAAKLQHISGDVKIDALIDVNGNVSTMKVLSGPPLLHQAALAALKQWKYSPAQLNGAPTAMHLTVTIQFRIQ